jgi:hypothetical protein
MQTIADKAIKYNLRLGQVKRANTLPVNGVGNGSQVATHDCTVPVGLEQTDGSIVTGTFTAPTINHSDLPALLGLDTLRASNAVLDLRTLKLYMCGPAGAEISPGPGSREFQMVVSPSGHLMLPCTNYAANNAPRSGLNLHTRPVSLLATDTTPQPDVGPCGLSAAMREEAQERLPEYHTPVSSADRRTKPRND